MLGSENAKALAEFYEKVLEKKPDMEEEGWYGWNTGSCFFAIGDHSEVKGSSKNPERILYTFETAEVQKEFDRLVKDCLLYTSDAADERSSVDIGGPRIIKKKNIQKKKK